MKISIFFATLLFAANSIHAQGGKNVDNFKINKQNVAVFFYDPLDSLFKHDNNFQSRPDKEKSDLLDKYLHEHPLYLFRLTNNKTKDITFLCIRGNPEKVSTKMFYKVEVIENEPADFNPNNGNYANNISQVIDKVNCGGTLFENMSLFDNEEGKKAVGNGIQLFGYNRRVQPYSEIKTSIENITRSLASL
ncbi:hypothetical protein [Parafilimonas terrae]|uniref:Uncharacterized protein n=1 Tax=Parafilimonas terrae TaxID=1465490 RepID=A0A1I5XA19_9BACT|nr:hypothetical protein [Parafilimonas terrae]SFQ28771.1 hypothetical protein SAMN05444277_10839 [Parafilimonas terrae]